MNDMFWFKEIHHDSKGLPTSYDIKSQLISTWVILHVRPILGYVPEDAARRVRDSATYRCCVKALI